MDRRTLLIGLGAASTLRPALAAPGLAFPADFGSHPESRTEWWYVTGSLQSGQRLWGFQVTFFRSRTGVAPAPGSRFSPDQLVFAHAALTDLEGRRLLHDQRIARSGFGVAGATVGDTAVSLRDWNLVRTSDRHSLYRTQVASDDGTFAFKLAFQATQEPLSQGVGGISRKGPSADDYSRYYSEPQLAVTGTLDLRKESIPVTGRAWLDHEWSDAFIPADAVGWDWTGMNLDDGSALTAFRLRRADGGTVWAGGSLRTASGVQREFKADEVRFVPGRAWESASTRARYPVEWRLQTPAGTFTIRALLDNQELDSRGSTGAVYWEGLSDLLDDSGRRVGRGYLEMTGYAAALKL